MLLKLKLLTVDNFPGLFAVADVVDLLISIRSMLITFFFGANVVVMNVFYSVPELLLLLKLLC